MAGMVRTFAVELLKSDGRCRAEAKSVLDAILARGPQDKEQRPQSEEHRAVTAA